MLVKSQLIAFNVSGLRASCYSITGEFYINYKYSPLGVLFTASPSLHPLSIIRSADPVQYKVTQRERRLADS